MLTDAQKEVFEVLKKAKGPLGSGEVFNRCQVASQRTVSLSLKQLADIGLIQKDKSKLYSVSSTSNEQSKEEAHQEEGHDIDTLSFVPDEKKGATDLAPISASIPNDVERDLAVMEKALAPLPQTEYSPQVKVQVLKRLSLLMDNSISNVLDDIVEDLEAVACRAQA